MPEEYPFNVEELNKELEEEFDPDEELEEEDLEELKVNPPKEPSFPVMTFCFALFKDLFDIISLFISLGILGSILNIIAWIVIKMYLFRKVGFIKKWLYKKYIFTLILEFIPIGNAFPQWTIFVLRGYAKEKKRVDQILTAIEKLLIRKTGAPKILEHFI